MKTDNEILESFKSIFGSQKEAYKNRICTQISTFSNGWNLDSNTGFIWLDIYNWVVAEYKHRFNGELNPIVCGLEMVYVYNAWITYGENVRGNIQDIHDISIDNIEVMKRVLFELNLSEQDMIEFSGDIQNIFKYALNSYYVDPNFKYGLITPNYNSNATKQYCMQYFIR